MNNNYYSVEQISEMLGVHSKTIQRYIREGKIRASKIGKSWRVSGDDLSRFTEQTSNLPSMDASEVELHEESVASSVIDLAVKNKHEAVRIINSLNAALNAKPRDFAKASMHTQFSEMDGVVRITLWGNIRFVAAILQIVERFLDGIGEG